MDDSVAEIVCTLRNQVRILKNIEEWIRSSQMMADKHPWNPIFQYPILRSHRLYKIAYMDKCEEIQKIISKGESIMNNIRGYKGLKARVDLANLVGFQPSVYEVNKVPIAKFISSKAIPAYHDQYLDFKGGILFVDDYGQ